MSIRRRSVFFTVMAWSLVSFLLQGCALIGSYHTRYVDEDYFKSASDKEAYPLSGTTWSYSKKDKFSIRINYPEDHRAKLAGKQTMDLLVINMASRGLGTVKFHKWQLVDSEGNEIEMRMPASMLGEETGLTSDYINKESPGGTITFYLSIPEEVQKATLKFDIEVMLDNGESHRVSQEIPLQKTRFFASGWRYCSYN